MFTKDSRYAKTPTVAATDAMGREVTAVKLRRLPETDGADVCVGQGDRLDVIAHRVYRDGARFWRVMDANDELDSRDLLQPVGRRYKLPER